MQVLAQAVEGTGGLDDAQISSYARDTTFDTVMGKVKFGAKGEWAEPRVLQVQFQEISAGKSTNSKMGRGKSWYHRPNSRRENFVFRMQKLFLSGKGIDHPENSRFVPKAATPAGSAATDVQPEL